MTATSHDPVDQSTGRDPTLWHVGFEDGSHAFCGAPLRGEFLPLDTDTGHDCVVCAELTAQYLAGTWTP